jgi:hypothetical protein
MAQTPSAEQLYRKFENAVGNRRNKEWTLGVFEGSPEGKAYSWCSDCIAARDDLRSFRADYKGGVKIVQFEVGAREEWKGRRGDRNPFKAKSPFISDLPTAILFYGGLDVARVTAPRKEDFLYLCQRAEVYDSQIETNAWTPPKQPSDRQRRSPA